MKIFTAAVRQPLNSDVSVLILMSLLHSHDDTLYGSCKSLDLQCGFYCFYSINVKSILAFHLRTALRDTDLLQTGDFEAPCWRPCDTAHQGSRNQSGTADVLTLMSHLLVNIFERRSRTDSGEPVLNCRDNSSLLSPPPYPTHTHHLSPS